MATATFAFISVFILTSPLAQEGQDEYGEYYKKWQSSHHQKSMLPATDASVLGNFNDQQITINGVTTKFFRKNKEFWVTTEDENGKSKDYKIDYTFGAEPLQQYLVMTERGKYQILPQFWDSRSGERGGQRWAHIYGDDHIRPNDRLHWTGPLQNWNGMCADCHSTGLKRDYAPESDQFETTWQNVNVSCASCHTESDYRDFVSPAASGWTFTEGMNTAEWSGERRSQQQIEVCAACHSRRTPINDGIDPGMPFLDQFLPTLIQTPEYFPDGQVKEEDYVWGSFLQSKMFNKGVICSDCHDPHSLELKASGNQLCAQCHLPSVFDQPSHHNHMPASEGAMCVNCHMPETTFMQVDARNDHSFRIPRPDLAEKTGSPDACSSCHADKNPPWAAAHIENWFGKNITPHYGEVFRNVETQNAGAQAALSALIEDSEISEIIRASGHQLLANYPNQNSLDAIANGLRSQEPLVRLGAIRGSSFLPLEYKVNLLLPLLEDEFKANRIEAYRALAALEESQIPAPLKSAHNQAKTEFTVATEQTLWRGEGHYNFALYHAEKGDGDQSIVEYIKAQQIDPYFSASYVNLADLYREMGNEPQATATIDRGLERLPEDADLNYSKGLSLIRAKKAGDALDYLKKSALNAPGNARYAYVYGVALSDLGNPQEAITLLSNSVKRHPNDQNINLLLLELYRAQSNWKEALKYAENLSKLMPNNQMIERIKADLQHKIGNNQ